MKGWTLKFDPFAKGTFKGDAAVVQPPAKFEVALLGKDPVVVRQLLYCPGRCVEGDPIKCSARLKVFHT